MSVSTGRHSIRYQGESIANDFNHINTNQESINHMVRVISVLASIVMLSVGCTAEPEGSGTDELFDSDDDDYCATLSRNGDNPVFDGPGQEICPNRITLDVEGQSMKVPYCRNYPLGRFNPCVTRAVVVIHGTNRNAATYYNNTLAPAIAANSTEHTMIIAPQFITESEIADFQLGDEHLFWSSGGWKNGSVSKSSTENPREVRYSSFSVIDDIVTRLDNRRRFPRLEEIVIVGHSAGGQFVNRYAAGTLVEPRHRSMKYIVANPSSYLYLNQERRIEGTVDQFAVPDAMDCPDYNEYKYGLDDLYTYMSVAGAEQIRAQYRQRQVVYLLGSEDNDPNSSSLAKGCAAMLQGEQRLERGTIFYNYLHYYYGSDSIAGHQKSIIEGVGHSHSGMFASECGMHHILGYNPSQRRCTGL